MESQIALLRGINVGGKNNLSMNELVGYFHEKGCHNVQTYIQSGNVVFEHDKTWGASEAAEIAQAIAASKGFSPHILILSAYDWLRVIDDNPFPTDDGKALHCFFLDSTPEQPNLARLDKLKTAAESYRLAGQVFYLFAPDGIGRSKLAAAVESALGIPVTARNFNTVQKLATMLHEA
ncbi:DUF1697 domain-containing protein [Acidihalobacter prosperus]|uniref:DUF1697 domain-containing protein n=1 Tax=Acidihalobacter prosperus TaxID=160660 RepID=A0A1A6C8H4_9GAMM|nr:DUF1697 domain-containing protein [Acidihalobacter prosperus]OBS10856.1 hypothetical protein Thpro_020572 [Acidihalobacter prosperus]